MGVQSLGWEESPGEGNGNPLQYSCLENPTDRGAWWISVQEVAKSWTQLSMHACVQLAFIKKEWAGRWEGGSGSGDTYNQWLIHVNVWQNPPRYCEVISLQLK